MRTSRTTTLRRRWATVTAGALVTALAACSSPQTPPPTPDVTVAPTVTATKTAAPTPPKPPAVHPLTGVEGKPAKRPALAVKVENTSAARPQTGLEQADVVWETVVEFQVSRLVAVFQSQVPKEIGPIRSVRPMDPLIVQPLQGLLAFSGGQGGIVAKARSSAQILSNDLGVDGMYRSSARPAPHNVYANPKTLWKQANGSRDVPPGEQFLFARSADEAAAASEGKAAKKLAFSLSSAAKPTWSWDARSRTWLRSEGSTPSKAMSGKRLSAVNVVSIVARHPDSGYNAQGGAAVPTYRLVGQGKGMIAQGGKTVTVVWKKSSPGAPLRLFLPGGKPATLAPGNTWVELVPQGDGSVTVS
ncbi:DUF3048 domain-containing protein [Cellulomonas massiliensis]|uniref:DUF3048 domain-containing protein n=1 Tax=Cellulomonas massiliensis TaxID=1465811 RepID=UPI001FE8AD34|nr:DUF3048 domain-containing protein [Cellulomonas massiliensis]